MILYSEKLDVLALVALRSFSWSITGEGQHQFMIITEGDLPFDSESFIAADFIYVGEL